MRGERQSQRTRRARLRRRVQSRRKRARRRRARKALQALTTSALALPGLAGGAAAQSREERFTSEYAYSFYSEDALPRSKVTAGGETDRYQIQTHQLRFAAPIADRLDLGLDVAYETMSGATPWYVVPDADGDALQVMTGASIEEARTDALLRGSYHFDSGQASLAGGASFENDYLAFNGLLEGERHFNEKNTTLSGGIGFSIDRLEPTDADLDPLRPTKQHRQNISAFVGISQVMGRGAAIQSSLTYQHARGFLSDPYKRVLVEGTPIADSRPDARNQLAWLTRYRQHVSPLAGTLHADYRFYVDDWQITSHTLELAWYQSLWWSLRLIPSVRYYSQSQAAFYGPWFDLPRADGLYSSDYRLSPYGALSWRLRAETAFSTWRIDWRASLSWERYLSSADLALGKVAIENPGLVSFNLFSIGLTARF